MKILFIDPVCPKPYDPNTLLTEPLGGTEATVIRIAEALAQGGAEVRVVQHNREQDTTGKGYKALYCPRGQSADFKPTHVVVLRASGALAQAKKQFPNAKLYIWCHDLFAGPELAPYFTGIYEAKATPILVSKWHQDHMYQTMTALGFKDALPSKWIYNPIADDLVPDSTPVDRNKMVFFSSPHKGLERTLEVFSHFKDFEELKDTKLYIANPGYFTLEGIVKDNPDSTTQMRRLLNNDFPGVVNLGPLPHPEVINQVRSAQAVLHLNSVFPETMGIVHAECNAVGTPFLSHRLGSTADLADHPAELIDVNDNKAVIDRLIQWKTRDRIRVRGNVLCRMKNVLPKWLEAFKM